MSRPDKPESDREFQSAPAAAETSAPAKPRKTLTGAAGERRMCLHGFERVELEPGESVHVTITADPRLLARLDGKAARWRIDQGTYTVALARAADAPVATRDVTPERRLFGH